jgi:hypothetical protein
MADLVLEGPYSRPTWREKKFFGRPWQDLIFAVGEIVFLASLFPLLFDESAYVSYKNWITVALTWVTATLWILIGLGVHI